jgi:outer membrane protein assembly factor BamB
MKTIRFSLILSFFILGSILLSACTGSTLLRSWPGAYATQDTVYVSGGSYIYAIDASNGTMKWRFPEKPDNAKPIFAAPAVTDNLIVVGTYGHMLYGLTLDGKQKWAYDSQNGNFVGGPIIVNSTILAPSSDDRLYAMSLDGKQLWSYKTGNALWASPASDGQLVYLPALDHNLYALHLTDSSLAWKKDLGSALLSTPLLTKDGTLYVSTMDGEIYALKAADGSQIWTANTSGRLWATPVLNQDTLYVGNASGKVTAISAKDGKITWQKDAGSPILAGGAVLQEGVVFPTEGGSVIAYAFNGEKELWRQTISGKLYTTPVVSGQTVTVAVDEGDKLAQSYNMNGQVSWPFVAPK